MLCLINSNYISKLICIVFSRYIVRWNNAPDLPENLRETLLAEESESDNEDEVVSSSECSSSSDGWDSE